MEDKKSKNEKEKKKKRKVKMYSKYCLGAVAESPGCFPIFVFYFILSNRIPNF